MLTKKYYKDFAEIIKNNTLKGYDIGEVLDKYDFKNDLADYFKKDNPKFDEDKFLKACGIEVKEK